MGVAGAPESRIALNRAAPGADNHPVEDDPEVWSESMLEDLEPSEHDFQEFKGARFIADGTRIVSDFTAALSKQISAFANGAGGHIFLGVDDDGLVDGGVRVDLKGGGTRSWLEDVLPSSVDPPLQRFNVFEVPRPAEGGRSRILPDHAVYVLHVPSSEEAPHQAVDRRYYLRIAGKSRPMGHVHILDVLRRTRHPRVDITRVSPYGDPVFATDDPRGPKVMVCFQAFVSNRGRNLARHVGAEVILPRPVVNSEVRELILEEDGIHLTQRPGQLDFFRYHPYPLFPGQEIFFIRFWVSLHAANAAMVRSGQAAVEWRVYADDAPAHIGRRELRRFSMVRGALKEVERMVEDRA